MSQQSRNILVTGGAGFIGSNFIRFLLDEEDSVNIYNLDALTYSGSLENLANLPDPSRHNFIKGNINQQELVINLLAEHHIDLIINFAAESHVDRSIFAPSEFIESNVVGTFNLLEAARKVLRGNRIITNFRFHHISTDEVYGELGPDDPPFSETTPYAPNSPYAASKASSDHLVRSYHKTYRLPITITNCSNNYGPYQFPEKLIPLIISNAISGKPLPIYGDGQQIRDWLFVEDHCRAIWLAANDGRAGHTYLIGGDNQKNNLQIVQMLCSILDEMLPAPSGKSYSDQIEFVEDRPGHDLRYSIDFRKIKEELAWTPKETLESGLRKTVKWYLENQAWINSIKSNDNYQRWIEKNYAEREAPQ